MLEYGPPSDDADMLAVARMQSWSFASPLDDCRRWIDRWGADTFRLLRVDGASAAALKLIDMGQWFGGQSVAMTGIAAVAVPPERRGRGDAARLMEAAVRELHDRGVPLSGLYPASQALYRRSGYEQAGCRWEIGVKLRMLGEQRGPGEVEPIDDPTEAREVYRRMARERNGYLDRGAYSWYRVEQPRHVDVRGFLIRVNGRAEGYCWLTQRMAGEIEIGVSDMGALTHDAMRALLRLLRGHSTLVEQTVWFGPPADPLLMLVPEQRYTVRLRNHWMLRVVNVSSALHARGYPPELRGEVHLDVADPLIPENAGRWVLQVEAGTAQVRRGGAGRLRVDVRGLAPLYSGFMSAEAVKAAGLLDGDDDACRFATQLFAGAAPCMPDMF